MFYTLQESPLGSPWSIWIDKWWHRQGWRKNAGNVFMLQSKMQNQNIKHRYYRINRDRAILFPVINWIGPDLAEAIKEIDIVAPEQLAVSLDGNPIQAHACRVLVQGIYYVGEWMVTDGYWIFIKPESLEKGKHAIESYGHCRSGKVQIAISYELEIK